MQEDIRVCPRNQRTFSALGRGGRRLPSLAEMLDVVQIEVEQHVPQMSAAPSGTYHCWMYFRRPA